MSQSDGKYVAIVTVICFVLIGVLTVFAIKMSLDESYLTMQETRGYIMSIVDRGFYIDEGSVRSPSIVYTIESREEFIEFLDTQDLAREIVFTRGHNNDYNYLHAFSPDYQIAWKVCIGYWSGDFDINEPKMVT